MNLNLKRFHLLLFLLFCLLNLDLFSTDRPLLLIGTNGKGAEGIYRVNFSESSGRSSPLVLAAKIGCPNFLALHPYENILYTVAKWETGAGVVGYQYDAKGTLVEFTRKECPDGPACHLAVHPSGKFLLTAQYSGGSVAQFSLNQTGELLDVLVHEHSGGSEIVANRQNSPHPHWCGFSPCGQFALVPDLGLDQIVTYKIRGNRPELVPHGKIQSLPGGGPRHMRFSPGGKHIFLLDELSLVIETFQWNSTTGQATRIAAVPTLQEDEKSGETFNSAAEILVHPTGNWVYSSNRGHDTVSVFKTSPNGTLKIMQKHPIRGAFPRNINMNKAGTWLLAAGQDSGTVSAHRINQETGKLAYQRGAIFNVPNPTCLLFAEIK